ncbi:glycoside hydrolase superfamily [Obelidium mucronatum]|nr:glycoside hydrolase superfamily [Obelidium mucronatum]
MSFLQSSRPAYEGPLSAGSTNSTSYEPPVSARTEFSTMELLDDNKQPKKKIDPKRRRCYIIIALIVIVLLAVAAGLTAYFVTKNKNSKTKAAKSTSSMIPGGLAYNLPFIQNTLIGYFGQNAVANGIGIVGGLNSRITPNSSYQNTLAHYCNTGYYNVINLAFLNSFGGGDNHFSIAFGSFSVDKYGGSYVYKGTGFETNPIWIVNQYLQLGMDIQACQAAGVKIMLSLGGDQASPYKFVAGDGKAYANLFYNVFLEGTAGPVRPFGQGVVLDGIELDVEKNDNPAVWTPEMIDFITTLRELSPKTTIAIVPQCYLGLIGKDANVGDVISATYEMINYVIVQYYNNPQCSYPFGFNFDSWKTLFPGSIILGLAGDWTSAISGGFLEPGPLQAVYDMVKTDPQFGGLSVYDVSSSTPPALSWDQKNFANPPVSSYSQTLRNVLNGVPVGSGFPPQGAQVNNLLMASRCGGTWVYANSICSLRVCDPAAPVTGCAANEHCFSFLSNTCV